MGFVNEQNFVVVKDIHITTFVFVAHVIITRFFFLWHRTHN
jgi:hypothetical protein